MAPLLGEVHKCLEQGHHPHPHTRQGPDYDATVQALKERYDQPRVTSRTIHRSFMEHAWKLTNEGIRKIITLIQRMVATMKECAIDMLETLYTVIAELHMPDEFFRYWTERTADSNKPPKTDRLIELLQQYRLRLQGRTDDTPASPVIHQLGPDLHTSAEEETLEICNATCAEGTRLSDLS